MSARLEVAGIDARLAGRPVLRNVDLRVESGELVALMGANGSGKTTLLNVICGHLNTDRGSGVLDDRPTTQYSSRQWARRVAVVPQVYELPAGFTVFELVAMARHAHIGLLGAAGPEDERAVRSAIEAVGLEAIADRRLERLSGGERQMVVVALALAQQPRLLLLDEPTSHLDLRHEALIMGAARRVCDERGVAALAVVHEPRIARRYADRVALMRAGHIGAHGRPSRVLTGPHLAACFDMPPAFFEDDESVAARVGEGGR